MDDAMHGSHGLDGRVAVVTGGGSGIGSASARALAAAGASVVVADLDLDAAGGVAEAITSDGGSAIARSVDVADADACDELMQAAVDHFGGLHVLHNSAGVAWPFKDGFTADVEPAVWDQVIAINLSGTFYCCHAALPRLAASGGGAIVNTASSMAHLPLGMLDGYAASKGGVAMLTRSMASGAGRLGVRVNAISPGYVDTPMNTMIWQTPELHDGFARGHATGLQSAEEIADVVVFLASDVSRSLTGAVLTCDRGWTAFKRPEALG